MVFLLCLRTLPFLVAALPAWALGPWDVRPTTSVTEDQILACVRVLSASHEDHSPALTPFFSWSAQPLLSREQLKNYRVLAKRRKDYEREDQAGFGGYGWLQIAEAELNGRKVFIKVSKATLGQDRSAMRNLRQFEREIFWVDYLSREGWGPKFHGVLEINDHPALVTDQIDGQEVTLETVIALCAMQGAQDRLREFQKFVEKRGVVLKDLQFRLNSTGKLWVVDPEFYQFSADATRIQGSVRQVELWFLKLQADCARN